MSTRFQDGNGRLHRCLIHHVLAERKFTPPGMVFPVSSVMLDRIDDYRETLQAHSGPLMPFIEWRPTPERNVEVLNDTADLYRYFDCTEAAEFLYACVTRTVEHDLPREIDYLRRHDEALRRIMDTVEMPDRVAENLLMFIRQNKGTLSKRRRRDEYKKLRDDEVSCSKDRSRCLRRLRRRTDFYSRFARRSDGDPTSVALCWTTQKQSGGRQPLSALDRIGSIGQTIVERISPCFRSGSPILSPVSPRLLSGREIKAVLSWKGGRIRAREFNADLDSLWTVQNHHKLFKKFK